MSLIFLVRLTFAVDGVPQGVEYQPPVKGAATARCDFLRPLESVWTGAQLEVELGYPQVYVGVGAQTRRCLDAGFACICIAINQLETELLLVHGRRGEQRELDAAGEPLGSRPRAERHGVCHLVLGAPSCLSQLYHVGLYVRVVVCDGLDALRRKALLAYPR